jgi:hypothetical protein
MWGTFEYLLAVLRQQEGKRTCLCFPYCCLCVSRGGVFCADLISHGAGSYARVVVRDHQRGSSYLDIGGNLISDRFPSFVSGLQSLLYVRMGILRTTLPYD